MYLVGGYDGTNATRDVLATTDGVRFRTIAQLPVGVRYPAVVALGENVYVFGGELNGTESSAVQQIDVRTGTARVVAQLPSPRTEASATAFGRIDLRRRAGSPAEPRRATSSASTRRPSRFSADGQLPAPVADSAVATVGG